MKIWSKKSTLDERQEQQLQHLEAQGFWLLWGGLALYQKRSRSLEQEEDSEDSEDSEDNEG